MSCEHAWIIWGDKSERINNQPITTEDAWELIRRDPDVRYAKCEKMCGEVLNG